MKYAVVIFVTSRDHSIDRAAKHALWHGSGTKLSAELFQLNSVCLKGCKPLVLLGIISAQTDSSPFKTRQYQVPISERILEFQCGINSLRLNGAFMPVL